MTPRHELAQAEKIGLLGDVHGDLRHVFAAISMLRAKGVSVIVQLGDFGFIWNHSQANLSLSRLEDHLNGRDQTMYFVDGNHENFHLLTARPVSPDGIRWIRTNIAHLPRGYRTRIQGGRSLAVLGGANSIDIAHRRRGFTWWEQEQITQDDLNALGNEHAAVMLSHDAPMGVPTLDVRLRSGDKYWPPAAIEYAREGRKTFHRGFMQVRPQLSIGGHYHHFVDETVTYESPDGSFTSRVVVLDQQGEHRGNCAILTTSTLNLEVFDVEGGPYQEGTRDD
ncbi:Calcineurin-like phosphoesterase superfamily domain-containing protein [Paramicrobacterium humi]|uniref:Calcineurin-like phosphoesterase superfamily domain-containing protein n=2 Tax=Paramicrobacterium humi TaxID=640635 RepID=A0A1H4LXI0_9MICO|nr:metallophosphoesterase [Microbacterium humi]SEB74922.1 Calcineurin-like phosphoesterase superfamily domain-containing protein [Microbacterium humi]